ncbi:hypothetical protein [Streptomyces sp. KL116D]|uniref:hypothetical protein n=1 Tax=Streptomyces sp. KL116D TaxID=3045152 RepID=UPI0035561B4D
MRIGRYADELTRRRGDAPARPGRPRDAHHRRRPRRLVARTYSAVTDFDPAALRRPALEHFAALADGGRVPLADLTRETDRA